VYETVGKEVKPNVIVNRFEQKMFDNGIKQADVQEILGEHFVGGIANNYRLVREAVDRGVPLHEIDPNANVVNDLKRIILPEEAVAIGAKSKSLFGLGRGLLKRKAG
ncbi:MAG: response regulator receiver protein, partial [Mesorhizobium sp.]